MIDMLPTIFLEPPLNCGPILQIAPLMFVFKFSADLKCHYKFLNTCTEIFLFSHFRLSFEWQISFSMPKMQGHTSSHIVKHNIQFKS